MIWSYFDYQQVKFLMALSFVRRYCLLVIAYPDKRRTSIQTEEYIEGISI